ncbi:hypothetical protein L6452_17970 [Arctium lappa]|uniref:Uncharacterized protein n=1 Tax=Arctium lappa TaxID=4217 RepID=A0ACB9C527_ARCLA|nr:hypothetical protein L6452_17970 [Arctium lappa]
MPNAFPLIPQIPSSIDHLLGFLYLPSATADYASERLLVPCSVERLFHLELAALMERISRPVWHAPWKNYRVISGHLGCVRSIAFDPSNQWFCTGSADRTIKVWDIRSKMQIHALSGHADTVCSVFTRSMDPQVVTGSHDSTIKFWDLRYGTTMATLTHHKKSVRALAQHPTDFQQNTIINSMRVNEEGVLATGGETDVVYKNPC